MNTSLPLIQRLAGSIARQPRFNPSANRFFVDDQPTESDLPLDHLSAGSPLFAHSVKRMRWLRGGEKGMRRSQIGAIAILTAIMVVFVVANSLFPNASISYLRPDVARLDLITTLASALLVGSVGLSVLHDLVCMGVALRQTRPDSLRELVHLSRMSHRGIIISQYSAIRLGAWRVMSVVFAARVVGVVALSLSTFVLLPLAQDSAFARIDTAAGLVNFIIQIGVAVCLGVAFIMEARWRLSGVAARALALGVQRENAVPKEFRGLFSLAVLWIKQIVFLGIIMFLFTSAAVIMVGWLVTVTQVSILRALFGSVLMAATAVALLYVVRHYYLAMIQRELHRAEQIAFRQDKDA